MSKLLRLNVPLAILYILAGVPAQAQDHQESIVLSVSPKVVRWADVYKVRPERPDDPYYHVRVIERQKDWKIWQFNELSFHMAVTPKALEASRINKKAKIYSYKDVEIRSAYHRWLDDPATRSEAPICDTDILGCIKQLPSR
ncbi:DUF5086 domain-containing protein [Phyllobacterium sp. SB3]|uniref:DUF5086 domain-containing protein n=1 Tax=Phyllobacterium sp. SB3 TaxID=3156073 RepID=UPI0032AF7578